MKKGLLSVGALLIVVGSMFGATFASSPSGTEYDRFKVWVYVWDVEYGAIGGATVFLDVEWKNGQGNWVSQGTFQADTSNLFGLASVEFYGMDSLPSAGNGNIRVRVNRISKTSWHNSTTLPSAWQSVWEDRGANGHGAGSDYFIQGPAIIMGYGD